MWILNWLPDWVFHLILLAGVLTIVASYVLRFVPTIRIYMLPIMVLGILLTITGVWYEGGIAKDKEYREAIQEYQLKLAKAEADAAEANSKIKTKIITKTNTIEKAGETVTQYIDREVVKYDSTCPLPKEIIVAHNFSARGLKIDENLSLESLMKLDHNAAAETPKNVEKKSWLERLKSQ